MSTRGGAFPLLAAALGALIVALAVALLVLLLRGSSGGSGTVPSVQGQTLDIAAQELHAAGFSISMQVQASTQPPGTVLSENPAPNSTLSKKTPVQLVVSGGPSP